MRVPFRRRSVSSFLAALVIALVAVARGGGVAIACEASALAADAPMTHDGHTRAPRDAAPDHEDCDAPERVSECLLMPACAPVVSVTGTTAVESPVTTAAVALAPQRAPAPVDRSPEPPPPRA